MKKSWSILALLLATALLLTAFASCAPETPETGDTTTVAPDDNTTTAPDDSTTTAAPDDSTTTAAPDDGDGTTTAAPDDDNTTTTTAPDDDQNPDDDDGTTTTAPVVEVTYKVYFLKADGSILKAVTVKEGEAATAPTAPEVEGKTFARWDTDFSCVMSDLTVKPIYETIVEDLSNRDISVTFQSNVAQYADVPNGTLSMADTDFADYFSSKQMPLGKTNFPYIKNGNYYIENFGSMTHMADGKYAFTMHIVSAVSNASGSSDPFMLARGYHSAAVLDCGDVFGQYEYDGDWNDPAGLGSYEHAGATGIHVSFHDGKIILNVKGWSADTATYTKGIRNYVYLLSDSVIGKNVTIADDGDNVYVYINGDLAATVALTGNAVDYDDVYCESGAFIESAVVTLADGTTETIQNTLIAASLNSHFGIAMRHGQVEFNLAKVQGFTTYDPATDVPEPTYYTVTFVGYNGVILSEQSVLEGMDAVAPQVPEVDGYLFTGWDNAFTCVTSNKTITAQYAEKPTDESVLQYLLPDIVISKTTSDYERPMMTTGWQHYELVGNGGVQVTAGDYVTFSTPGPLVGFLFATQYASSQVNGTATNTTANIYVYPLADGQDPAEAIQGTAVAIASMKVVNAETTIVWLNTALKSGNYVITFGDVKSSTGESLDKLTFYAATALDTVQGFTFSHADRAGENIVLPFRIMYVKPEPTGHTVTFVDHDGTVLSTQTVDDGAAATAPTDPTREGYTFAGWDVAFDNVTGDLTVTAQYTANESGDDDEDDGEDKPTSHTVTFVDHDGTVLSTQTVAVGAAATAPADPTREGYTFTGWDVAFDNVTGDLKVTAQYDIDPNAGVTDADPVETVDTDITVTFTSDATQYPADYQPASNRVDLKDTDIADYFSFHLGAGNRWFAANSKYWFGDMNAIYRVADGKYAFTINIASVKAGNERYDSSIFARGYKTVKVNDTEIPYYEYDGDWTGEYESHGATGIHISFHGGNITLRVKARDNSSAYEKGVRNYDFQLAEGCIGKLITLADDGSNVYVYIDGELAATVALSGSVTYNNVEASGTFAKTAVVTLESDKENPVTIQNTLVAAGVASEFGIAIRNFGIDVDLVKAEAYTAFVSPEQGDDGEDDGVTIDPADYLLPDLTITQVTDNYDRPNMTNQWYHTDMTIGGVQVTENDYLTFSSESAIVGFQFATTYASTNVSGTATGTTANINVYALLDGQDPADAIKGTAVTVAKMTFKNDATVVVWLDTAIKAGKYVITFSDYEKGGEAVDHLTFYAATALDTVQDFTFSHADRPDDDIVLPFKVMFVPVVS